jgi:pimeloyl-ACP methyl ester carboxylesterase
MTQAIAATRQGPIEYRLEGRGPVVMVLNGGHCTRASRLSHERLAQEGFSVLTPSRPGYDGTPSSVGRTAQQAADALAGLLDALGVSTVDVIGISAAGPTALAFAQRHGGRTRRIILESAVTLEWDEKTKRLARLGFGRAARVTWAAIHLMMRIAPGVMIRTLMRDLTTLDVERVLNRMPADDMAFVRRMILDCGPGGFVNDIEHTVDDLAGMTARLMAMYSPHDQTVSPRNSLRLANEVPGCQLYEVPCDTHLIWIGPSAGAVWEKRLSFLTRSE